MIARFFSALALVVFLAGMSFAPKAFAQAEPAPFPTTASLVMLEEKGCRWCAAWTRDIGPIYPKTPEGQAAPLLRLDIHDPLPEGLTLARPAFYTPTFVLVRDGVELARIEGYPGEDFFWGLLGMMLKTHTDFAGAS